MALVARLDAIVVTSDETTRRVVKVSTRNEFKQKLKID